MAATITVPVRTFRSLKQGQCDIDSLRVTDGGDRVTPKDNNGKIDGIKVKGQGTVFLEFDVVPFANPTDTARFTVVGLAMNSNGLTNGANPQKVDFVMTSLNGNRLELRNNYKKGGPGVSWELWILVSDRDTPDPDRGGIPAVGIIDPEIDNTEVPL